MTGVAICTTRVYAEGVMGLSTWIQKRREWRREWKRSAARAILLSGGTPPEGWL